MNHQIEWVPVDLIDPHPHNPRRELGDLTELAASIREAGVLQNLTLVPQPDNPDRYWPVMGHRRLAAAQAAELEDVMCVIRDDLDLPEQVAMMVAENVHRDGLSPIEEASCYQDMLDQGWKPKDIVAKTGRPASTVHARLQLLKLPEQAREKVHSGQATLDNAADLQKLDGHPAEMERVANALGTSNFDWELKQARQRIARDEALAPLYTEAERLGATRGDWNYNTHDSFGGGSTVEAITGMAPFPPGTVYEPAAYSEYLYLYTPKSAEKLAAAQAREAASTAERDAARASSHEFAEQRAAIEAEAEQASTMRGDWIRQFCGRKRILAKESLLIVQVIAPMVLFSEDLYVDTADLAEWLGLEDDSWQDVADVEAAFDEFAPSCDRSLCLLVVLHMTTSRQSSYGWEKAWNQPELVALYGLLEQLGYPVSDAERARITPPADESDVDEAVAS